jgi:hypothetical protein
VIGTALPLTERQAGSLPQEMGASGVRKIFRRRQGKRSGTNPLLREIGADKIGELLVDSDDLVCRAGQRSQHMDSGRVAW